MEVVDTVAAREARMGGTTVTLTSVIDLIRDPRWSRLKEFFSEDPVSLRRLPSSARADEEVIQIYIRDEVCSMPRSVLELGAFRRVTLQPGENRTLCLDLSPDDLALRDAAMQWHVEPGTFTLVAGPSSAQLKSTGLKIVCRRITILRSYC
ncbi:fibronectin type III-like domain-contianing protein [Sphingobium sufflavum]|nr:fibronectin type III-like domain-contianing protein [Sphingobium sufflavum]